MGPDNVITFASRMSASGNAKLATASALVACCQVGAKHLPDGASDLLGLSLAAVGQDLKRLFSISSR